MLLKPEKIHDISRSTLLLCFGIPFALIFTPFTVPILLAMFVAFGVEPVLRKITSRTKERKYFATGVLIIGPLLFLIPFFIFLSRAFNGMKTLSLQSFKNSQLSQSFLVLWEKLHDIGYRVLQATGSEENIVPTKDELIDKVGPIIIEKTSVAIGGIPDFGLSLFVFFCFLYLLITRGVKIKNALTGCDLLPPEELDQITQCLKKNCNSILISTLLVGAIQAAIVSIGSLIFGYHELFLIFCLTFFLSLIPIIGAAPVAVFLAVISFLNGNTTAFIGLIVVSVITGTIDNVLKPYLFASKDENLHPLISLLGIIGAIIVFGLPGLLLGPLITQVSIEIGPIILKKFTSK